MTYRDIQVDEGSEDFIQRLIKENLWSREFTLQAIDEYRKFLYLASLYSVAPSFVVDQVWHSHMLFSKDYAKVCNQLGGKFIHHQPEKKSTFKVGGKDAYLETKVRYESLYGEWPSPVFWADFYPTHHIYVDINRHWVVPVGDWRALLTALRKHFKLKINGLFKLAFWNKRN